MNRTITIFQVPDLDGFKQQMLDWANRFNIFIFLDSHEYTDAYSSIEWILATDPLEAFRPETDPLTDFSNFLSGNRDWLFGHISYDFKNHIAPLHSNHPDGIGFPDIFFFRPGIMIRKKGAFVEIASCGMPPAEIFRQISSVTPDDIRRNQINIQPRISRPEYLETVQQLQQHILRGDCYEINFCQEFFAKDVEANPLDLYRRLSAVSPMPFAGFYKLDDKFLACASPERFVKRHGADIISQPIKGTIKRDPDNAAVDAMLRQELYNSPKERSENVMIVDLVRNDLSRICREGSVQVEQLYGIHTFPQVHQMVSTVKGAMDKEISLAGVLEAAFPMGSMTGAPKMRVLELTEQYEKTKRGIYSGSIGYIDPQGNFDLNVVIRSIMYNSTSRYLSYLVGGAITFYSDPEKEYEECLLKAAAIKKVLQ